MDVFARVAASTRFTITAHQDVKNALLQLSPGWAEGMQINTIEPGPLGEASRNGDLLFTLGHIPAGRTFRLFMQFQVDPTNVGRRQQNVSLYDGKALLATLARRCVERGYGRLEWSVLDWNAPSIAFYDQLGAEAMGGWTNRRLTGEALANLAD